MKTEYAFWEDFKLKCCIYYGRCSSDGSTILVEKYSNEKRSLVFYETLPDPHEKIVAQHRNMNYYYDVIHYQKHIHRIGKPAIIYSNGTKHWNIFGNFHRLDGPASEYVGSVTFYVNDERCSEKNFPSKVKNFLERQNAEGFGRHLFVEKENS